MYVCICSLYAVWLGACVCVCELGWDLMSRLPEKGGIQACYV